MPESKGNRACGIFPIHYVGFSLYILSVAAEKNAKRISKICEFLTVCPKLIDANLYRKFWKIHPQFVIDEYRNALAYPNLISGGAASKQQQDKVRMLEEEA